MSEFLLTDQAQNAVNTIILGSDPRPAAASAASGVDQARILFRQFFIEKGEGFSVEKDAIKGQLQEILALIPASMSRESDMIRNLIRNVPVVMPVTSRSGSESSLQDFDRQWTQSCERALLVLPYGIKQLWVCAYQSWLWNYVADYTLYGSEAETETGGCSGRRALVAGDVVVPGSEQKDVGATNTAEFKKGAPMLLSLDDIETSLPMTDSSTSTSTSISTSTSTMQIEARVDPPVAGSPYTMRDLVLPSIGKHMLYPDNAVGQCYLELLQVEGLIRPLPGGANSGGANTLLDARCDCGDGPRCTISCRINRGLAHLFKKNGKSSLGIVPRGSYRHVLVSE
jgi:tRNA(Glu) U13 pseudouridine synthase TruD